MRMIVDRNERGKKKSPKHFSIKAKESFNPSILLCLFLRRGIEEQAMPLINRLK